MAFGATDIPNGALADAQKTLRDLEKKLADAKARRDKILDDIRRVGIDIDSNKADGKARAAQGTLNKQDVAEGRLIKSLEMEVVHAARQAGLAQAQADAAEAHARQASDRGEPARLLQLEIRTPDGRMIRQWHKSLADARKALQPGYIITGEVIGSGVVSPVGDGARPFMKALLDAQGDVLMEWLLERGIVGSDKTVVVLPSNGREKMQ